MAKKPTYGKLRRRGAEFKSQQQLLTEIPDRKKAEEALRHSEARLKHALEIADVGCWEWDIKTGALLWSEQTYRQMGEQPDQCSPRRNTFLQYVHPEDRAVFASAMDQTLAGQSYFDLEFRIVRPDGGIRILHSRGEVVRSPDGRPLRMFGVSTDITDRKGVEEVLREKEYELEEAQFLAGTGSWTYDPVIKKSTWSKGMFRIWGLEPSLGLFPVEDHPKYIHPDDYPHFEAVLREAVENGIPFKMELRILRPDGNERTIITICEPLYDVKDKVWRLRGSNQDITERKRAEEALRNSEQRFKIMTDASPLAIYASSGIDQRATYVNPAFVKLFGYTLEDVPSVTEWWPLACPDETYRNQIVEEWQRKVENAIKTNSGIEPMEVVVTCKDGSKKNISWGYISTPRQNFAFGLDLTVRKHAEQALREAKEQLELRVRERTAELTEALQALRQTGAYTRSLIESSLDPLVTIGRDGTITDANAAAETATGRVRQELIGTDFSTCFTDPEKARTGYLQVFRDGSVRDYPLEICHQDGRTIPVLYNATLYRDEAGQVVGIFAAARDITARKRAEEALRQANADLDQRASQLRALTGELALSEQRERSRLAKILHDHLQQLLVAAKFRVTILGRTGDDVLKQAGKEVEELIDESIAASRSLTAELSPPILNEAGLNAGLQWLARRMADTQGLFVNLELAESGPLPEDIKVLLFESVRELLLNVVKHANTRSAMVNLRRFDRSLQVTVSDEGAGFDPTTMPAAGKEGGGFGLFSIRERLGLMGGTFEMESIPGQGSRVVLSVPVAPSAAIEPPLQGIPILPEAHLMPGYPDPGLRIRVLLADDHTVVRQGIANLLKDQPDIEVIGEAADGQEAVELAAKLLPDAILMDMSMPKLNGVEATRSIHNDWPEIRIIGLSMFEEAERAQAMRDAGAVDYITKSGPAEDLINVIRTSIGTSNKVVSTNPSN